MPDGIRWVGLDVHARESTFAIFDQATGEVMTKRVMGRCQWPSSSPHWRPRISPLVAIFLPTGGHESPHQQINYSWCVRRVGGPPSGRRLGESVAVLPVGDQDVRVVQQSLDGRGREAFRHQLVEP